MMLDKIDGDPYKSMESASLREVEMKTLFLLTVASGHRCSGVYTLSVGRHMVFCKAGVTLYFRPGFLARNERSDFSIRSVHYAIKVKSKQVWLSSHGSEMVPKPNSNSHGVIYSSYSSQT